MKKLSLSVLALAFAVSPAFAQPTLNDGNADFPGSGDPLFDDEAYVTGSAATFNYDNVIQIGGEKGFVDSYQNNGTAGNVLEVWQDQSLGNVTNQTANLARPGVGTEGVDNIAVVQQENRQANPGGVIPDDEYDVLKLIQDGVGNSLLGVNGNVSFRDTHAADQNSFNGSNWMDVNQMGNQNDAGLAQYGAGNILLPNVASVNSQITLPAGFDFKPSNYADIDQDGDTNTSLVRQQGYNVQSSRLNELKVAQTGDENFVRLLQETDSVSGQESINSAVIEQNGDKNKVAGSVSGNKVNPAAFNMADAAKQLSTSAVANGDNILDVLQDNNDNQIGLYQETSGFDNGVLGGTHGAILTGTLNGVSNYAHFKQTGMDSAAVYQTAGTYNRSNIIQ